jgi:phosphonate transport system permease protein
VSGATLPPRRDPAWIARVSWTVTALVLLWPLLTLTEFRPAQLWSPGSREPILNFLGSFFPPAHSAEFLQMVARETWRTVAMATAGIVLGLFIAVPGALLATESLSVSLLSGRMAPLPRALRQAVRWTLIVLRSVPELVWALVFVRVLGLGPAAAVLALALTYGGMLAKVYAEILESSDTRPARALLEAGSGRLAALGHGLLPGAAQELVSYTVYRWECAVRASVVMGFVGAGGLGQLMDQSMKMLNGGEACSILIVFLLLVLMADALSALLRKWLA